MLLARNLKLLRNHQAMTQDDLAESAEISKNYLAEIETGRKYPSPIVFARLAKALNVPAYYLIFDECGQLDPAGIQPPFIAARRRALFLHEMMRLVDDYLPGIHARPDTEPPDTTE